MSNISKRVSAAVCALAVTMSCFGTLGVSAEDTAYFLYEENENIELLASGDVQINSTTFPDDTFRSYVSEKFDTNNDNALSQDELANATKINVSGTFSAKGSITSLKGIEYFTNLQKLDCEYNQIKTLDLSNCPKLTWLSCTDNRLSSLDVTNNPLLENLYFAENAVSEIDLSNNPSLKNLINKHNYMPSLDVSNNPELELLNCAETGLLSLDVSNNTKLNDLYAKGNPIKSLYLGNNTALTSLTVTNCNLKTLDISRNTALISLYCGNNLLTSLDVSNNTALQTLNCNNNRITQLDVSKNTALQSLTCGDNPLVSLDVSNNTALRSLSSSYSSTKAENYYIDASSGSFSLSKLPGRFDPSKASNWIGATYDSTSNTINITSDRVTYSYDCGNGFTRTFALSTVTAPLPGKPVIRAATGKNSAVISWGPVENATNYSPSINLGSKLDSAITDTYYELVGLNDGETYRIDVAASNGQSSLYLRALQISAPLYLKISGAQFPAQPKFDVTFEGTTAKLTWDHVPGATKYRVQFRVAPLFGAIVGSDTNWKYSDFLTTDYVYVNNCVPNVQYDFLVTAWNDEGQSFYLNSDIQTEVCPKAAEKPAKPTFTATPDANGVTLNWNAVSGAAKYIVAYRINGTTAWTEKETTSASYTVTGLTNGMKYDFLVLAGNDSGWSDCTDEDIVSVTLPLGKTIPKITVTPTAGGANVYWDAIDGASMYWLYVYGSNGLVQEMPVYSTSCTIGGLTPGQSYGFVAISYINGAWDFNWTADDMVYAFIPPEKTVPTLNVTPTVGVANVSWDAVPGAYMYWLYVFGSNGLVTEMPVYGTSTTVTGLEGGQGYAFVAISYINGAWDFNWTSDDLVYAFVPPAKTVPTLNVTPVSGGANVSWDAIPGAYMYWLYVFGSNGLVTEMPVYSTSATVTGLTSGQEYAFVAISYINGAWDFNWTANDLVYSVAG